MSPTVIVAEVKTAAIAALDVEVPMTRTKLFRPFAEAVSANNIAVSATDNTNAPV
ncbi:hypothetical protein ABIE00_000198 [Arthrobacter sp. OAP107]